MWISARKYIERGKKTFSTNINLNLVRDIVLSIAQMIMDYTRHTFHSAKEGKCSDSACPLEEPEKP